MSTVPCDDSVYNYGEIRSRQIIYCTILALLTSSVIFGGFPAQAKTAEHFKYAIVISKTTAADNNWSNIAKTIAAKYETTKVFQFTKLSDLVAPLADFSPDYIAYVAKPQEASPGYIRRASWLNRQLGNRPYGQAVWGVVTGYGSDDAMRIASNNTPPSINFGLGGFLGYIDALPEGVSYSEFLENRKIPGNKRSRDKASTTAMTHLPITCIR